MTGEELYGAHRRSLNHQGITTTAAMQEAQPPKHWYQLDERTRQAWEETAAEIDTRYQAQLNAVSRSLHRDPNIHGTPRITDGMLRPVGSEAYGGGPAGF
jgi:hypothetical protein